MPVKLQLNVWHHLSKDVQWGSEYRKLLNNILLSVSYSDAQYWSVIHAMI